MIKRMGRIGIAGLVLISAAHARDGVFLREKTLEILDANCPDGSKIVRTALAFQGVYQETDFTNLITGDDERACVTSINTIVHEDNHGIHTFTCRDVLKDRFGRFSDVFYKYDYFYLNDGRFTLIKKTATFPSRELVQAIPERLRTFRFEDYIATDDTLQSTQNNGIYGLLDEFNSYYQGTRAGYDLLHYYENKGETADWHDHFTGVNTTHYGCLEFRFFILTYLMYAKTHHPDIYRGILNNKAWCATFMAVDRNVSDLIRSYFDKKPAIFERLRGYGWKVVEQDNMLYINAKGRNIGHMNFIEVFTLLDGEMKKPEYLAILRTVEENAAGWDMESTYAEIARAMKDTEETDTRGGAVDVHAPRLENRRSLEDVADLSDPEGDTNHSFVDLVKASVAKDDDGLLVRMRLAGLPDRLIFNQPGVPENQMEYRWAALFDMDGDGVDEYSIEVVNFKDPDAGKVKGGILENTQQTLWKMSGDGADAVDVTIRGGREESELILDVSNCDFVSSIGKKTRVHFKTFYTDGKNHDQDLVPD